MQERKQGCICELDVKTGEPVYPDYPECPVHKSDGPTPWDTANKLVNKLYGLRAWELMDEKDRKVAYGIAKESAIVNVNDILSILEPFGRHEYAKVLIPHYEAVKEEIQKL